MAELTAVEFLKDQLEELFISTPYINWDKIFEEAKEMEKQQIIDAVNYTSKKDADNGNWLLKAINQPEAFEIDEKEGENYYNEKFKK